MSWLYFQEQWTLNQKVTFDGVTKIITIGSNITALDIKADVYSAWKEWLETYDNAKFLPAIRATGGDTISPGKYTGDIYFLTNGWRILIDHACAITGVLYSDNYPSPYITDAESNLVTNTVSSLVQTVTVGSGGAPTAAENAEAVWGANIAPYAPGTAGNKLKQGLTTGTFIALK